MTRTRALCFTIACAFVTSAAPARAQFDRPIGDDRLAALSQRYFADLWKLDPPRATRFGVHDYDDQLGSYDASGFAARLETARHYLSELRDIDPSSMGADASYDARILEASLESSILSLGTLESWKHRPAYYTGVASDAVASLLAGDAAPLGDRVRSLVARERQMPALFDSARQNLTSVDAATAEFDRGDIEGTITYFKSVVPQAVLPLKDARLRRAFATANAAAIAALDEYRASLDASVFAHPSGTFAIGADRFAERLRLQELVPISFAAYRRAGQIALARTRAAFVETAKSVGADPHALGPEDAVTDVPFVSAQREKLSLVRQVLASPSFAEGWAEYVEQTQMDTGSGSGDPKVRLAQLRRALVSECRYLVSLREQTQGMTIDEGAAFFQSNAFLAAEPARREALRGAVDPLSGNGTLGKLELLKLRDDFKKSAGSTYSLQNFRDAVLAHGQPPIAIARKFVLGADDDGELL